MFLKKYNFTDILILVSYESQKIIDLFKDPETLKELLAKIRNKKQKL